MNWGEPEYDRNRGKKPIHVTWGCADQIFTESWSRVWGSGFTRPLARSLTPTTSFKTPMDHEWRS